MSERKYRLERGESAPGGVARVALGRIDDALDERRRRNLMNEVLALASARLRRGLESKARDDGSVQELLDEVVARRLDPASAAARLLERDSGEWQR